MLLEDETLTRMHVNATAHQPPPLSLSEIPIPQQRLLHKLHTMSKRTTVPVVEPYTRTTKWSFVHNATILQPVCVTQTFALAVGWALVFAVTQTLSLQLAMDLASSLGFDLTSTGVH